MNVEIEVVNEPCFFALNKMSPLPHCNISMAKEREGKGDVGEAGGKRWKGIKRQRGRGRNWGKMKKARETKKGKRQIEKK